MLSSHHRCPKFPPHYNRTQEHAPREYAETQERLSLMYEEIGDVARELKSAIEARDHYAKMDAQNEAHALENTC